MKFGTKVLHAGIVPDPTTGAIMTPIFQTSTYIQERPGKHKGFEYARTQNPTRSVLEENLAALENAKFGRCFSSGMGAIDAVVKLLAPGDEVICTHDLYGGSYRLFTAIYQNYGIIFKFVDLQDLETVEQAFNKNTKMIWIESPTNPVMRIVDISAIVGIANSYHCLVCVDNTFATPYLQNPIDLGANIVVHSVTKYISGHSDVVMGAVITNDKALDDKIGYIQNSAGAIPSPNDCFLVLRGIKTLHLRMDRHCENGEKVALFLENSPYVDQVFWPGFSEHPNHQVAKRQMRQFGGMISFTLKNDHIDFAFKFMGKLKLFSLAESLGGVESLIGHPASMTHASIPKKERLNSGLTDSLIRLSVGIEDIEDLIEDLKQALEP